MLLGAMAPGPDFVVVARNSMMSGRRAGMASAAGVADTAEIGVTSMTVTLAWFLVLAAAIATLRRVLTRKRVRQGIDAAMGTLLVGLGVRIALQSN